MRGYFGVAIYNGKTLTNLGTLWRTANILGANYIATIGNRYNHQAGDTMKTPRHIPLFHFDTFEDFYKYLPEKCKLVGIEIDDRAKFLKDFKHPQQCCYLLGAEDEGIPLRYLNKCEYVVKLKGDTCYNMAVAGSIVLYDRINSIDT